MRDSLNGGMLCGILALGAGLAVGMPLSARAQTDATIPLPDQVQSQDARSVDYISLLSHLGGSQISIGDKSNGLTRQYQYNTDESRDNFSGQHVYISIDQFPYGDLYSYLGSSVNYNRYYPGGDGQTQCNYTTYPGNGTCENRGLKLTFYNPALPTDPFGTKTRLQIVTFTNYGGTQVVYDGAYRTLGEGAQGYLDSGHMTKVTRANGEILRIYYKNMVLRDQKVGPRIQSVVNNYGYMLKYEYWENNPTNLRMDTRNGDLKSITAINLAVEYCDPNADSCTLANSWPKWTYDNTWGTYAFPMVTMDKATNPLNQSVYFTPGYTTLPSGRQSTRSNTPSNYFKSNGALECPLYQSVCLENMVGGTGSGSFIVNDGNGNWTYAYNMVTAGQPLTVQAPLGGTRTIRFDASQNSIPMDPRHITSVTDENGNVTRFEYDPVFDQVSKITYPENNYVQMTYDDRGNLTERRDVAKPGAGLADRVWTASYDTTCTNSIKCNKPNWVRDPNANTPANIGNASDRKDFIYDTVHGGVLTETDPPDAGGVRPQIRNTYTALYAQVRNSSGVLVNAEAPIYKLTRTSTCRTATAANPASCVGTANETVTTYAYNSNNLLLTSKTVAGGDGSNSATTSYAYDNIGNLVSVDGPRTDVIDVSYTAYDLLRRPVYEIGADPDGAGSLKRAIIRHLYDVDGNETRTETGTGSAITFVNGVPTDVTDFVVSTFKRNTYDPVSGHLVKTEVVQP